MAHILPTDLNLDIDTIVYFACCSFVMNYTFKEPYIKLMQNHIEMAEYLSSLLPTASTKVLALCVPFEAK
jgi:hypothetical protein